MSHTTTFVGNEAERFIEGDVREQKSQLRAATGADKVFINSWMATHEWDTEKMYVEVNFDYLMEGE